MGDSFATLRELARAEEEKALSLIKRGARLRGAAAGAAKKEDIFFASSSSSKSKSASKSNFASNEWQRISNFLESPTADEGVLWAATPDEEAEVPREQPTVEEVDLEEDSEPALPPPPAPASPPASPTRFGYEDLLSDVGRAYCGYSNTYFESCADADAAAREAATARQKVAAREREFDAADESPATAKGDFWVSPPPGELSDEDFERRLFDLRGRFEGAPPVMRTTEDWAKVGIVQEPLPVPPMKKIVNVTAKENVEPAEDRHLKLPMIAATKPPPPPCTPLSAADNTDDDDDASLFLRALALSQKPVSPPLSFAPLSPPPAGAAAAPVAGFPSTTTTTPSCCFYDD